MLREDFQPTAPGILVDLPSGHAAFVPNPLPPQVALDFARMRQVEEARAVLSELAGLARLTRNLQLIIRAFARREAIESSRLEGTQTEIEGLLLEEAVPEDVLGEDTDLFEVLNYLATITFGAESLADGRPLSASLIRELHARLMQGVRGSDKHPGSFRARDVYIGRRQGGFDEARFVPPPHERVSSLVDQLVSFAGEGPVLGPLVDIALLHYQFECIHPFEDGNGRLGRLLMPLQLIAWGAIDRPLLYLAPYFERHADEYRDGLLQVSLAGAWNEWIRFVVEAVHESAVDARQRVQRLIDLDGDYQEKAASLRSRYASRALHSILESVITSVPQLQAALGVSAPAGKTLIDGFVGLGILEPYRRVRGRQTWIARQVLDQLYGR
ncbi:MAG: Fic family protein [Dehalococcoidia bacterium]